MHLYELFVWNFSYQEVVSAVGGTQCNHVTMADGQKKKAGDESASHSKQLLLVLRYRNPTIFDTKFPRRGPACLHAFKAKPW